MYQALVSRAARATAAGLSEMGAVIVVERGESRRIKQKFRGRHPRTMAYTMMLGSGSSTHA